MSFDVSLWRFTYNDVTEKVPRLEGSEFGGGSIEGKGCHTYYPVGGTSDEFRFIVEVFYKVSLEVNLFGKVETIEHRRQLWNNTVIVNVLDSNRKYKC